jgi:cyclopropane fatty-acyl-phospholipid synthase-like methyltransferase
MKNSEIKEFYNSFLKSRMLEYRLSNGNERINLASKFILNNIKENDKILEIGCGIGIVTERIAKKLTKGFIWACDISDQNIWYAKKTIHNKNIDFFVADIVEHFESVKERINNKIDVFIFVDVLEHIPKENHLALFNKLDLIASEDAKILLTFPSEYYQQYLIQNNPKELQIIDEIISLNDIIKLTEKNNFIVKYFELKDVWMNNQYVHCKVEKSKSLASLKIKTPNIFNRIILKILRYFRKRKYIYKLFKN